MASFKTRLIIFSCCLLLIGIAVTTATSDCPTVVQSALKTIDNACSDTGRNQACYGNIKLLAEPQPDIDTLNFRQKGDRVSLVDVKNLKLSAMDPTSNSWGVALLKVQANLPDTVPGQNVTFLLFGDVSLDNMQTPTTSPASSAPVYGPMQAFTFRTGLHDAPCSQAPSSGILIQSPTEAKVQLRINEIDVTLGSTIYVQLTRATEMMVSVVEGQATLTAFGKTVVAPAGTRVRVAIDAITLAASSAPSDAEAYAVADLASLPVQHLPIQVVVAPPLDVNTLATLVASESTTTAPSIATPSSTPPVVGILSSDLPISGSWHSSMAGTNCPDPTFTQTFDQYDVRFTFEQGGTVLRVDWAPGYSPAMSYNRVDTGIYLWSGHMALKHSMSTPINPSQGVG
jgi:hypothetical protein